MTSKSNFYKSELPIDFHDFIYIIQVALKVWLIEECGKSGRRDSVSIWGGVEVE